MAVPHVEEAGLGVGGRLGSPRFATGGTEAALAAKADGMKGLADQTAIPDETVGRGATAQRLLDRRARGGGNISGQPPRKQWFDPPPMVPQDGLQPAGRLAVHTPIDTVACLKSPYFS